MTAEINEFFSFRRNVASDGADWTSSGRLFQSRGPGMAYERSPTVTHRHFCWCGPGLSHPPSGRLPLLSARPAVTFPVAEHHRLLAGTKVYCLLTEAHSREQLAQGCYAAFALSRI